MTPTSAFRACNGPLVGGTTAAGLLLLLLLRLCFFAAGICSATASAEHTALCSAAGKIACTGDAAAGLTAAEVPKDADKAAASNLPCCCSNFSCSPTAARNAQLVACSSEALGTGARTAECLSTSSSKEARTAAMAPSSACASSCSAFLSCSHSASAVHTDKGSGRAFTIATAGWFWWLLPLVVGSTADPRVEMRQPLPELLLRSPLPQEAAVLGLLLAVEGREEVVCGCRVNVMFIIVYEAG